MWQSMASRSTAPPNSKSSFVEDDRNAYGETRYRAWGLLDGHYHCLAFTHRNGRVRAISLRRAHKKEIDRYVSEKDR